MGSRALSSLLPIAERLSKGHDKFCELEGLKIVTFCSYRNEVEQNLLYARGRTTTGPKVTNAKGGESYHQYKIARDIVSVIDGKAIWDATHHHWDLMGKCGVALGFDWGGNWRIPDKPHFQLDCGLETEQLKTMDNEETNNYIQMYLNDMGIMKTLSIVEKE